VFEELLRIKAALSKPLVFDPINDCEALRAIDCRGRDLDKLLGIALETV
jgi:hypothetical protein